MSAIKESKLPVVRYIELDQKKQKVVRKWRLAKAATVKADVRFKEARDSMATNIGVCKIVMPDDNVIQVTQSIREDIAWARAFKELHKLFWPIIADNPEIAEKYTYFKQKAELTHKSPPTPRWEVREIVKENKDADMES